MCAQTFDFLQQKKIFLKEKPFKILYTHAERGNLLFIL